MEPVAPFEATQFGLVLLGILVVAFLVSIALSGWSMRLANNLCGGAEAGFFWSVLAVVVSALLGSGAMMLTVFLQPDTPPWLSMVYGMAGSVVGIAVVMAQNPLRAFGTYIIFSIVGTFAHIGFAFAVILLIYFAVPKTKMTQIAERMSELKTSVDPEHSEKIDAWLASAKQAAKPIQMEQERSSKKVSNKVLDLDGVSTNPFVQ